MTRAFVLDRHLPVVVGVTGFAQVGKDTTADILVASQGYTKVAFADPLRGLAWDLDPILAYWKKTTQPHDEAPTYRQYLEVLGYEKAKECPEFRGFLKDLGAGCRKHLGADVWIRAALAECPRFTVVSDVRFVNEAEAVRARAEELGGKALIIRVDRPGVQAESDFEREVSLIRPDVVLANDGTVDTLEERVFDALGDFMVASAPLFKRPTLEGEDPPAEQQLSLF